MKMIRSGMDAIKEGVGCINPHWIVVVGTGIYTYLRQICIIGLCFERKENEPPFDPSYASVIFIFSALCLVAEYRLWPRSLRAPPAHLLYIYEMVVAALVANLTNYAIWIPLMHAISCLTQTSSKWLLLLNSTVGFDDYSFLTTIADYLSMDAAATHMAFCLSLLSFFWMLDATESLDMILELWAK